MQDRSLLRNVDLLTLKHRIDPRAQTGFLGQLDEEPECLVRDQILRVIQVDAQSLCRHTLAALGIIRKEIPEM
jgi:hypothetical protein